MSNFRVIYPTDEGGVAVIIPAAECGLSIEEIAAKDVPPVVIMVDGEIVSSTPRPYKIVDVSDIPSDRLLRNAWEYTA
ncbi:MAG: hypothetical protein ACRCX2_18860 [Paraclostridium sp.]